MCNDIIICLQPIEGDSYIETQEPNDIVELVKQGLEDREEKESNDDKDEGESKDVRDEKYDREMKEETSIPEEMKDESLEREEIKEEREEVDEREVNENDDGEREGIEEKDDREVENEEREDIPDTHKDDDILHEPRVCKSQPTSELGLPVYLPTLRSILNKLMSTLATHPNPNVYLMREYCLL